MMTKSKPITGVFIVDSCKIKEFLSIKAHTASDAINRIKRRDKRNYYE